MVGNTVDAIDPKTNTERYQLIAPRHAPIFFMLCLSLVNVLFSRRGTRSGARGLFELRSFSYHRDHRDHREHREHRGKREFRRHGIRELRHIVSMLLDQDVPFPCSFLFFSSYSLCSLCSPELTRLRLTPRNLNMRIADGTRQVGVPGPGAPAYPEGMVHWGPAHLPGLRTFKLRAHGSSGPLRIPQIVVPWRVIGP